MRYLMILALLGACTSGDETVSGYVDTDKVFTLESIDDTPLGARATIQFPGQGKVLGEAPCNRWSANQTAPYPWVKIDEILSTKRGCAAQAEETRFFDALRQMTLIEAVGNVVIFSNEAKREMVFRAQK